MTIMSLKINNIPITSRPLGTLLGPRKCLKQGGWYSKIIISLMSFPFPTPSFFLSAPLWFSLSMGRWDVKDVIGKGGLQ